MQLSEVNSLFQYKCNNALEFRQTCIMTNIIIRLSACTTFHAKKTRAYIFYNIIQMQEQSPQKTAEITQGLIKHDYIIILQRIQYRCQQSYKLTRNRKQFEIQNNIKILAKYSKKNCSLGPIEPTHKSNAVLRIQNLYFIHSFVNSLIIAHVSLVV